MDLKHEWLRLPEEQREALLQTLCDSLAESLGSREESLEPTDLHVYAMFRRPSTLSLPSSGEETENRGDRP